MSTYNEFQIKNNMPLEFEFEPEQEPTTLFARKIAKSKRISIWHAQTALFANGVIGDRNA